MELLRVDVGSRHEKEPRSDHKGPCIPISSISIDSPGSGSQARFPNRPSQCVL
jgi:hypothetical protein